MFNTIGIINMIIGAIKSAGFKLVYDKKEKLFLLQNNNCLLEKNWKVCRQTEDIIKVLKWII